MLKKILHFVLSASLLLIFVTGAHADGSRTFSKKCGSCHSATFKGKEVGKASMGPDLTGITTTRGAEYVRLYIVDPNGARKKHPEIYEASKGKYKMKMPPIKMDEADLKELVDSLK